MGRKKGWNWIKSAMPKKLAVRTKRRITVLAVVGALAIFAGAAFAINRSISTDLPKIAALKDYHPPLGTSVYSEDDHLLGRIKVDKGIFVPLPQIPDSMKDAMIAVEDARFYEHEGLDFQGVLRAIVRDIASISFREGGSTITQQLAKVMFLTREKSLVRKLKEAVLAREMERKLTKDEILELYLNKVYFGHGAYGVEMAARTYFGKHVGDLTLAESAMIAGLPKAPSNYSPYNDMKRALQRRDVVLDRMVDEKFISQGKADQARGSKLVLKDMLEESDVAPHLVEQIRVYLEKKYGMDAVYNKGLKVRTTINFGMQKAAKRALASGITALTKRQADKPTGAQGALVSIDPWSGKVKAMVGGADFKTNEYNHALSASRQPGSAFKPFVYAAAMDNGFNPAYIIVDEPKGYDEGKWTPENADRKYNGPTSLRDALTNSLNVVTIELLNKVGTRRVIDLAKKAGLKGPFPKDDLTLALGSCSVTPFELTAAYCAFANGGIYIESYYISSVKDPKGKVLERGDPAIHEAMSPIAAYQVTSMLVDAASRGTGKWASSVGTPVAGKTGTTNGYADAWFVGYSQGLVTGVWVGNDDRKSLGRGESGARAALPVWNSYMWTAKYYVPIEEFQVPDGVVFAEVDAVTGEPPTGTTERVVNEVFREGDEPGEESWLDIIISPSGIKDMITGVPDGQ